MKTSFQLEINSSLIRTFFPEGRIKDKYKIIEILLEACRYMLYNEKIPIARSPYKMILSIEKMSRLIFVSENKLYSIYFPFNLTYSESELTMNYKNYLDIDSQNISILLSILKSPYLNSENCLDFIDPIVNLDQSFWITLRDLLITEDGYIRYDKDEIRFKEAQTKKEEHRHPLNHIDIFYSNQVTLKLGLSVEYVEDDLIDLMNINTNCKYLINHVGKSK